MPERLILTKNAQFYRIYQETTEQDIVSILDSASENIEPDCDYLINNLRQEREALIPGLSYRYSVRVFPTSRDVYFLEDIDVWDRVYAYILIIELGDYIAILKKSCANISELVNDMFEPLSHEDLISTFDNNAEYEKLSTRNMTISEHAMRSRTYEAANLKGLMSTHAAGRSIPYYCKARQSGRTKMLTPKSSRLVEASARKKIDEIVVWIQEQIELIENNDQGSEFLSAFAKSISLREVLSNSEIKAILIESSSLIEQLTHNSLILKWKARNNKLIPLSNQKINKLISYLSKVYEVDNDCKIIDDRYGSWIKPNDKSITFNSPPLKKIQLDENGKTITLQSYIIKKGLYSVCFENPKYMYFMKHCFEDSSGVSEINSLIDILIEKQELTNVTSEKGEIHTNSQDFDQESVFGVVEEFNNNAQYLFCDDLGNEWADHIAIDTVNRTISFIHSKHGDVSTSASNLHDVVGQGIKNLGVKTRVIIDSLFK